MGWTKHEQIYELKKPWKLSISGYCESLNLVWVKWDVN